MPLFQNKEPFLDESASLPASIVLKLRCARNHHRSPLRASISDRESSIQPRNHEIRKVHLRQRKLSPSSGHPPYSPVAVVLSPACHTSSSQKYNTLVEKKDGQDLSLLLPGNCSLPGRVDLRTSLWRTRQKCQKPEPFLEHSTTKPRRGDAAATATRRGRRILLQG